MIFKNYLSRKFIFSKPKKSKILLLTKDPKFSPYLKKGIFKFKYQQRDKLICFDEINYKF